MPASTNLRTISGGSYTVTQAGAVLDGVRIGGDLIIAANDVVIRNSQIDGSVSNEVRGNHYSFRISASTVGPASGCITSPGIGEAAYTASGVLVRGHDDGFRISGNSVRVQHSYARLCANSGSHSDGIQSYCPAGACSGLVFDHNTVDGRGIDATFMINLNDPQVSDVSVTNNLLAGGAYTMVTKWTSGPTWTVTGNRVVDRSWVYGPVTAENTCSHQSWSGNAIVAIDSTYRVVQTTAPLGCIQ